MVLVWAAPALALAPAELRAAQSVEKLSAGVKLLPASLNYACAAPAVLGKAVLVSYIMLARPYANITRDPVYASAHASKVISQQPQAPLRNAIDAPSRKLY